MQAQRFKAKVCVVGEPGVGKTSLIRRYVLGDFSERQTPTRGHRITNRGQLLDLQDIGLTLSKLSDGTHLEWPPTFHLDMVLWDIMGSRRISDIGQDDYFVGARGVLAVADGTRPQTLETLPVWMRAATRAAGELPVVLAVNKSDLARTSDVGGSSAEALADEFGASLYVTSAKTGLQVEKAFRNLAADVVLRLLGF